MNASIRLKTLARNVKFGYRDGARLDWDKQDEWQHKANGYRCCLKYKGRKMAFDFWCGVGITSGPDKISCLDSLLSDAQAGEQSFDEFCGDFGYDEDSIKARRTWKACQRMAKKVRALLGNDFDKFLYADRN